VHQKRVDDGAESKIQTKTVGDFWDYPLCFPKRPHWGGLFQREVYGVLKKALAFVLIALAAAFVAIQFIPGEPRDNPPAVAPVEFPQEVETVMRDACMDCHSNETRWPWYSKIAPTRWYTARDVQAARAHLNFSNWGAIPPQRKLDILTELWDRVVERRMPHKQYTLMHPKVELSVADRKVIRDWVFGQVDQLTREINAETNAD
jgi:hypothetical protein